MDPRGPERDIILDTVNALLNLDEVKLTEVVRKGVYFTYRQQKYKICTISDHLTIEKTDGRMLSSAPAEVSIMILEAHYSYLLKVSYK